MRRPLPHVNDALAPIRPLINGVNPGEHLADGGAPSYSQPPPGGRTSSSGRVSPCPLPVLGAVMGVCVCPLCQCCAGPRRRWRTPSRWGRGRRSTASTPACATSARRASPSATCPPSSATAPASGTGPKSSAQNVSGDQAGELGGGGGGGLSRGRGSSPPRVPSLAPVSQAVAPSAAAPPPPAQPPPPPAPPPQTPQGAAKTPQAPPAGLDGGGPLLLEPGDEEAQGSPM